LVGRSRGPAIVETTVSCKEDIFGPYAQFDLEQASNLVFGQDLLITCNPGFALHKDRHNVTTYSVSCGTDGKVAQPLDKCVPIDCGKKTQSKTWCCGGKHTLREQLDSHCPTGL